MYLTVICKFVFASKHNKVLQDLSGSIKILGEMGNSHVLQQY